MEDLKVLINLISKNKTKSIEVIGNNHDATSNYQKLYDEVASGRITSDEEAMEFFFPETQHQSYYLKRLK